jgi:hypothetical protein
VSFSKNNPGPNSCYAKAKPDEPMFVLLARDPLASELVRWWAECRAAHTEPRDMKKISEALDCADAMEKWRLANPPEPKQ